MPLTKTYFARQDSSSANNPALNLTGAPAIELTFVAQTDTGGSGDLFLEQPSGGGIDPDTQVEINGTSYSFTYEFSGIMPTQNKNGAAQVPDQYEGSDVAVITVQDYPSASETTRYAFMPNEAASAEEMDAFGNGAIDVQSLDITPDPAPICFSKGTLVTGQRGEIMVEDLKVGDLVLTVDFGMQPVRWVSHTNHVWPGTSEDFKPILIASGSLGEGRPYRDLVVSPQHRMLLQGPDIERTFLETEVLAPAKGLTGLHGVRVMKGKRHATYYHILLDRHCVIKAEGAFTESFYPGPIAFKMMSTRQCREIIGCFPKLRDDPQTGYGPKARRCLTRRETADFVQNILKLEKSNETHSTSYEQQLSKFAAA